MSVLFSRLLPCQNCGVSRLQLLENAVVNYGGGLFQLIQRAHDAADHLRVTHPDDARVLTDVVRYLTDVAKAGELDLTDWHQRPFR